MLASDTNEPRLVTVKRAWKLEVAYLKSYQPESAQIKLVASNSSLLSTHILGFPQLRWTERS